MRNTLLIVAAVLCFSSTSKAAEPAPEQHASPEAVYKAYREACQKRDWRTAWNCFTTERQKEELFECYYITQLKRATPQLMATIKKHGLELEQVNTETVRLYEQKHRVKYTSDTKLETELGYEAIFNLVADKPGFYEGISNLYPELASMKSEALNHITRQENSAQGHTTMIMPGPIMANGQPTNRAEQHIPKVINFAKVNGGWLLAP